MGLFRKILGGGQPASPKSAFQPPAGRPMQTLDPRLVVEPFSKVNLWDLPNGGKRVRAYILLERPVEGAQTGVALDGSGSMMSNFGRAVVQPVREPTAEDVKALMRQGLARQVGGQIKVTDDHAQLEEALVRLGVFRRVPAGPNIVEQQARSMTEYLSKFDADGGTTVIYWATGDGKKVEVVGDFTGSQCATAAFPGPSDFGSETHLVPAIRYFVERFPDARWGIYVFITDGALNDLEAVKEYSRKLARDIAGKKRNDLKFVLIGVGSEIDEGQMEQLDDLSTGTNVDLWDHKIAKDMKQLAEIFAEVVSETVILVPGDGVVKDPAGAIVRDLRDTGLPALLWLDLPPGSDYFTLEVADQVVHQPLRAGAALPKVRTPGPPPAAAATPASPPPQAAPGARCIECGEPLASGARFCGRCGTDQTLRRTSPATPPVQAAPVAPPPKPEPAPKAPVPTATAAAIVVEPQALDFGSVTQWRGTLPSRELKIQNQGGSAWSGTVQATVPWLSASPAEVVCPGGGEVVVTVALTAMGGRLPARDYRVPDGLIVEGQGQSHQVAARLSTK